MDIYYLYVQFSCCGYCVGGGVGNIVKFKVQEYFKFMLMQIVDKLWVQQGEYFFVYFQVVVVWVDVVDKCQCFIVIIIVECNYNGRGCDSVGRWDSCRCYDQILVLMGVGVV